MGGILDLPGSLNATCEAAKAFVKIHGWLSGSQTDYESFHNLRPPAFTQWQRSRKVHPRKDASTSWAGTPWRLSIYYENLGIQGSGGKRFDLEDCVGSAWLPACRLRSLSKVLPGFVAGVQGVRQKTTNLAISCTPPTSAATNRELEGRWTQHISTVRLALDHTQTSRRCNEVIVPLSRVCRMMDLPGSLHATCEACQ